MYIIYIYVLEISKAADPAAMSTSQPPTPFHPALILVDLQVDFSPPDGTLAVTLAPGIIPHVLSLLSLPFPLKIFTKDSHPPDHISFASNHQAPNNVPFASYTTITHPDDPSKSIQTRLWPVHCVRGTTGWEFLPPVKEWVDSHLQDEGARKVVIVEKGRDPRVEMYSAFQDPFGIVKSSPSLEAVLRENSITDVYVAGLAGDYCVKETVKHCGEKGYRVWVVREGVASVDEGKTGWGEAKAAMESAGGGGLVRVIGVDEVEIGWVRNLEFV